MCNLARPDPDVLCNLARPDPDVWWGEGFIEGAIILGRQFVSGKKGSNTYGL